MLPPFRDHVIIRADLEHRFPRLRSSHWQIKSPDDDKYNCFAWAACDGSQRWEPFLPWYWPPAVAREHTVPGFIEAFATLGYTPCNDDRSFEFGFQKVAIYADEDLTPTHMARQHFLGRGWLSKLGYLEDISHPNLTDVEGDTSSTSRDYGVVVQVLKRSWWVALTRLGLFRCWWATFKCWLHRMRYYIGI